MIRILFLLIALLLNLSIVSAYEVGETVAETTPEEKIIDMGHWFSTFSENNKLGVMTPKKRRVILEAKFDNVDFDYNCMCIVADNKFYPVCINPLKVFLQEGYTQLIVVKTNIINGVEPTKERDFYLLKGDLKNNKKKKINPSLFKNLDSKVFIAEKDGKFGLISTTEVLIPFEYDGYDIQQKNSFSFKAVLDYFQGVGFLKIAIALLILVIIVVVVLVI